MKNVLEYLEKSAVAFPQKAAVEDQYGTCSFLQLQEFCMRVGSSLVDEIEIGDPVAVYMEKGIPSLTAFLGIVYAGGFYTMFNPDLPAARLRQMHGVLNSRFILTDREHENTARELFPSA